MKSKYFRENTVTPVVKKALDGRSSRWLAEKLMVSESYLSFRMNGIIDFTDEELRKIKSLLKIKTPLGYEKKTS